MLKQSGVTILTPPEKAEILFPIICDASILSYADRDGTDYLAYYSSAAEIEISLSI